MSLQDNFRLQLQHSLGHVQNQRILCAVSGGPDSMVMLSLLLQQKLNIGVAHCNFKLRKTDSDSDEQLVIDFCNQHGIPVYTRSFDTASMAADAKTGIQETARNLRYEWFNTLLVEKGYDLIATAHHADDNAETVLFHLIRGTGMTGASGIPYQTNRMIRPLLHIRKKDILEYAEQQHIPFRLDHSNSSVKYARNKIRHEVIPSLNAINPKAIDHINAFAQHSKIAAELIDEKTKRLGNLYFQQTSDITTLNCIELIQMPEPSFWLFELLKPYNATQSAVHNMVACLHSQHSGALFYTPTHQLVVTQQTLVIHPLATASTSLSIQLNTSSLPAFIQYHSQTIQLDLLPASELPVFDGLTQYIDLDLAGNVLTLRNWIAGDRFYPYGMKHQKKVSDYLSDRKVNVIDKKTILVLENNREIIAIVGHQISNNIKLTPDTKHILRIAIKQ